MGFNVTRFKVTKLEKLKLPLKSFYDNVEREDLKPELVTLKEDGSIELRLVFDTFIKAKKEGEIIEITEFDMTGEGSGTAVESILIPALKDSTGILNVSIIYEGQFVYRLTSINGNVNEIEVDF